MMIKSLIRGSLILICFNNQVIAAESQFYVFPIKDIEGLGVSNSLAVRPLVDKRVVEILTPNNSSKNAAYELGAYFNTQIINAYPTSVVNAKQVIDVVKGPYKLIDDDGQQCGDGSLVPLKSSYAAILGVSRISLYKVDKGAVVELLIPVTLNLQIVKPDRAKIIYATSNTMYSRFEFSKSEIDTPKYNSIVSAEIVKNIKTQIDELVSASKVGFVPKSTPVKIIGKDGNFVVAGKGFEVGFKDGDEPEAVDSNGNSVIFKVISADEGYSILELASKGDVRVGQDYSFVFETQADDSRKPRVMPVTTLNPEKAIRNGVIDVLTKSLGSKAPFQISAVDVNFSQTMQSIRSRANCAKWEESATQVKDSKLDPPPYILTIETGETKHFVQSGKGAVMTKETFSTIVQAKVSDLNGVVYGSAIGTDKYVLEKTSGIGLSVDNAREVSYQNATKSMADDLLKVIKFQPKEFKVKSVNSSNQTMVIESLPVEDGFQVLGSVVRKLSVKIANKDALVRLPLTTNGSAKRIGKDVEISYQLNYLGKDYYSPKSGDSLIVHSLPKGDARNIDICDSVYIGKNNSVASNFSKPITTNVLFNSPKFQMREMNKELVSEVNQLLDDGYFQRRIKLPEANTSCLQPGYLIREEKKECKAEGCNATVAMALVVKIIESDVSKKDYVSSRLSQLKGFDESSSSEFYSLNAFDEFNTSITSDLSKQINGK